MAMAVAGNADSARVVLTHLSLHTVPGAAWVPPLKGDNRTGESSTGPSAAP